jgi:hypothetical protein
VSRPIQVSGLHQEKGRAALVPLLLLALWLSERRRAATTYANRLRFCGFFIFNLFLF